VSISIYYSAARTTPLGEKEKLNVEAAIRRASVDEDIEQYLRTGQGLNWESFSLFQPPRAGLVLEGSTKLPDNSDEAVLSGVRHWCRLLSTLRSIVKEATWRVAVEDHEIPWDEERQAFDHQR
jgi:hypothetical protein